MRFFFSYFLWEKDFRGHQRAYLKPNTHRERDREEGKKISFRLFTARLALGYFSFNTRPNQKKKKIFYLNHYYEWMSVRESEWVSEWVCFPMRWNMVVAQENCLLISSITTSNHHWRHRQVYILQIKSYEKKGKKQHTQNVTALQANFNSAEAHSTLSQITAMMSVYNVKLLVANVKSINVCN